MIRVASMNASKPLAPSAQSTIQTTRPAVTVRTSPMLRASYRRHAPMVAVARRASYPRPDMLRSPRQGACQLRHNRTDRARRVLGRVGRGPYQPGTDDHAVRTRIGGCARLLGRADPEPERDRHRGARLRTRENLPVALGLRWRGALPGRAGFLQSVQKPP